MNPEELSEYLEQINYQTMNNQIQISNTNQKLLQIDDSLSALASKAITDEMTNTTRKIQEEVETLGAFIFRMIVEKHTGKYVVAEVDIDDDDVTELHWKSRYIGKLLKIKCHTEWGQLQYEIVGSETTLYLAYEGGSIMKYITFNDFDDPESARLYVEVNN